MNTNLEWVVTVVTRDSKEEVMIFRYRQTLHHNIYIIIIIITLTNNILPSRPPRLPRPQKDEDGVLRKGLEVLPVLHLGKQWR